jgi:hypothetical protein
MAKKKLDIRSEFSTDIFNLFVFIALGPVDFATKIPVYILSVTLAVLFTILWAIPMFFIGSVLATTIKFISLLTKLIKSIICTR